MPANPDSTRERPASVIGVYDRPSPWRSPRLWIAVAVGVASALVGIALFMAA
jgi:hypothetical protein